MNKPIPGLSANFFEQNSYHVRMNHPDKIAIISRDSLIASDYSCCPCKCIFKCKTREIEVLVYLQGIYIRLIKWDAFTSHFLNIYDIKYSIITSGLLFVLTNFNHIIFLENLQRKSEIEKRKMHNCRLAGKKKNCFF